MEPRYDHLDGIIASSSGGESDGVAATTAVLEDIARDRLATANNHLASIATGALPDVRVLLLEVIADLDNVGYELRRVIIALRNGHDD